MILLNQLSLSTILNWLLQQGSTIDMADGLRASGKIYVVVAVLVCIFVGILLFLLLLERRIKRLEKQVEA